MGEKALPTIPLEVIDRVAEGELIDVNAEAVAANERIAVDSFMFV